MSSKSAAATNSFLVLNAPTKKVQNYKQMKPTGAVSWVWDHFSAHDPKYNRKSQAVCNDCFLKKHRIHKIFQPYFLAIFFIILHHVVNRA